MGSVLPFRPVDRGNRAEPHPRPEPVALLARVDGRQAAAQRLLGQEPEVLARYQEGLRAINSPLVSDPQAWEQCVVQARRILMDCAVSLAEGRATVTGTEIAEVVNLGGDRIRQGLHLTHSIRAGMLLLDIVLEALADAVAVEHPEPRPTGPSVVRVCPSCSAPDRWAEELAAAEGRCRGCDGHYTAAVRSLQEGVSRRLAIGSVGYDTFLLNRVQELNDLGRRRLARDIHDQLGNSLSLALRQLELHDAQAANAPSPHVKAALAAVLEALDTTRQLVTELRRSQVSGSLELALKSFAASMSQAGGTVRVWVKGSDDWVPEQVTEELFVIVRECLRNAMNHAKAGNIVVHVDIAPHEVQVEVLDDGCGFDLATVRERGTANGLDGMRERVQLLNGALDIRSAPGRGTQVLVWVPIDGQAGA
ncbi:sensor histidine kinase [Kitasatospora sp. NPDC058965]|uniref:sensor histidine kinase n=1 Tax=Kitasatospora sp. NPDC058965 TaxID=3346682 RepID=UPI0036D1A2B4